MRISVGQIWINEFGVMYEILNVYSSRVVPTVVFKNLRNPEDPFRTTLLGNFEENCECLGFKRDLEELLI